VGIEIDVVQAPARGTRRESRTVEGEMPRPEFEGDSRMPRDASAVSCYIAVGVGVGAVADDAVGRGIDSWRVIRGTVVVVMHRVVDRRCPATIRGYRDASPGMAL
jgi:hypothetical protein